MFFFVLSCSNTNESLPVLWEEIEGAAQEGLKAGKSRGLFSIPSELLKHGDEATTTVLTAISKKIWETKGRPKEWT